jgi:hypothetical protein
MSKRYVLEQPECKISWVICKQKTKRYSLGRYDCETWSLIFREECRLRVFENRLLRRIFGLKRDEVTGKWRRLHNK